MIPCQRSPRLRFAAALKNQCGLQNGQALVYELQCQKSPIHPGEKHALETSRGLPDLGLPAAQGIPPLAPWQAMGSSHRPKKRLDMNPSSTAGGRNPFAPL